MWGSQTFFGKSSFLSSRFHLYLSSFSFDALILSFIFSFISSLLLSFIFSLLSSLLFSCLVSSLAFFSCPLVLSRLLLFSIVLSLFLSLFLCLSFSVFFLCLSLSLSVPVCPCLRVSLWWLLLLLCLVCMSLWSWCVRAVWWGTLKTSVCTFKTSPCVPAPRPHVVTLRTNGERGWGRGVSVTHQHQQHILATWALMSSAGSSSSVEENSALSAANCSGVTSSHAHFGDLPLALIHQFLSQSVAYRNTFCETSPFRYTLPTVCSSTCDLLHLANLCLEPSRTLLHIVFTSCDWAVTRWLTGAGVPAGLRRHPEDCGIFPRTDEFGTCADDLTVDPREIH